MAAHKTVFSILLSAGLLLAASSTQTDWTGGPGVLGPVTEFGSSFSASDSITYNVSGQISPVAVTVNDGDWIKRIVDLDPGIDGHGGLYPADFDGDGDLDFSGWMTLNFTMHFYKNMMVESNSRDFVEVATYQAPPGTKGKYGQTWAGDLNNDGRPDVVVACSTRVFWYENNGNFDFTLHEIDAAIHTRGGVEGADVNRDGRIDLVVGDRPLDVYYQQADGTFRREYVWRGRSYKILVGNINNDAWPDILAEDNVFLNNNGVFPATPTWSAGLGGPDGIWIRDFNNDALPDLLIADQWANSPGIYWYENLGNGTNFRQHLVYSGPDASLFGDGTSAEDVNGDGRADVVGSYARVGYFEQDIEGLFSKTVIDTVTDSHWIRTGNIDYKPNGSDVDIDIYISARGQFTWYENAQQVAFARNGWLNSSVLDAGAGAIWQTLSWDATRPPGTELDFYVRTGPTVEECLNAAWNGPISVRPGVQVDSASLAGLATPGHRYFQYRVLMAGDNSVYPGVAPAVYSATVEYAPSVDVGVGRITAPVGDFPMNEDVVPVAEWHNYGTAPVDFIAYAFLTDPSKARVYSQSKQIVGLAPGGSVTVDFPAFNVGALPGWWVVRCSTFAAGDRYPGNDAREADFRILGQKPVQYGWVEVEPVPFGVNQKPVKDGGWLTADASGVIYGAKGNKTPDFYGYSPRSGNSSRWQLLAPIPVDEAGRSRPFGKGSRGVSDGEDLIYVVKGNGTAGFWQYDIVHDEWSRLPDVPLGATGKTVASGSDLAYHFDGDTGWVYLMKGYKTEFYRYNIPARRWDVLPDLPYGAGKARYGAGSFLVSDNERYIYAHQSRYTGATGHFMFRFDLQSLGWDEQALTGMPLWGYQGTRTVRKRSKDGGAGAYSDGRIYALKGGNSQQFFRYEVAGDAWVEMDAMPSLGSTLKTKRVKNGGDLVYSNSTGLHALKGNKTLEFWRYIMPPAGQVQNRHPGGYVGLGGETVEGSMMVRFEIGPNPTPGGLALLRYSVPAPGPAAVSVFDMGGRLAAQMTLGLERQGSVALNLSSLQAGVYLARFEAAGLELSQKLVISR